jgi:signal transduction histidine kinase
MNNLDHTISNKKSKLPILLIYLIFVLTIIPFIGFIVTTNMRQELLLNLININKAKIIYIILEWSSVCIAFFIAIFAFAHYKIKKDRFTSIIGTALLFVGFLDLFFILASNGILFDVYNVAKFNAFTWPLIRTLYIVVLIISVSLILANKKLRKVKLLHEFDFKIMILLNLVFIVWAYSIIYTCSIIRSLPNNYFPNSIIGRPWDLFPLALWLIAGLFILSKYYRKFPSVFSHSLFLSSLPAIACEIALVAGSKTPFDFYFLLASSLKVLSYLILLLGLYFDYIYTYMDDLHMKRQISSAVKSLEEQKIELEKSNYELDHFVYMASHDLKTPLRSIASFTDLIEEDFENEIGETGATYLNKIRKGIGKMENLINQVLTLSRIDRVGKDPHETDMNTLIHRAVAENKDFSGKKAKFIFKGPFPKVFCEEEKIEHALALITRNAITFTTKETGVFPTIEIGYKDMEDMHCFYVKDNGIGIDPEYHNDIFNIFIRLNSPNEYPGYGIGLYVVKKIISQHNGNVWVESEAEKGACFYFTLPKK